MCCCKFQNNFQNIQNIQNFQDSLLTVVSNVWHTIHLGALPVTALCGRGSGVAARVAAAGAPDPVFQAAWIISSALPKFTHLPKPRAQRENFQLSSSILVYLAWWGPNRRNNHRVTCLHQLGRPQRTRGGKQDAHADLFTKWLMRWKNKKMLRVNVRLKSDKTQ